MLSVKQKVTLIWIIRLALENKETLKNENKLNLQKMIEVKSKEMKTLLVKISGIEDENCLKDKRTSSIDAEISDLEARVAKLKKEKVVITLLLLS